MVQTPKRPYRAPHLQSLGTVADMTRVGQTNNTGDSKNGSVHHTPLR